MHVLIRVYEVSPMFLTYMCTRAPSVSAEKCCLLGDACSERRDSNESPSEHRLNIELRPLFWQPPHSSPVRLYGPQSVRNLEFSYPACWKKQRRDPDSLTPCTNPDNLLLMSAKSTAKTISYAPLTASVGLCAAEHEQREYDMLIKMKQMESQLTEENTGAQRAPSRGTPLHW